MSLDDFASNTEDLEELDLNDIEVTISEGDIRDGQSFATEVLVSYREKAKKIKLEEEVEKEKLEAYILYQLAEDQLKDELKAYYCPGGREEERKLLDRDTKKFKWLAACAVLGPSTSKRVDEACPGVDFSSQAQQLDNEGFVDVAAKDGQSLVYYPTMKGIREVLTHIEHDDLIEEVASELQIAETELGR